MNVRAVVLMLGLLSVVSTGVVGYLYYDFAQESALKEAENQFVVTNEALRDDVLRLIFVNRNEVRALAQFEQLSEALQKRNEETLLQANRVLDHFALGLAYDVCFLIDSSGNAIASSNRNQPDSFVGHNYSFRFYFRDAMQGMPGIEWALGVVTGVRGIFFSHPVYAVDGGGPVGLVVIKVSTRDLDTVFLRTRNMIGSLMHESGIIFVSSRPDWILKLLWRASPEEQSEIAKTQQFGKGPWDWTGVEKRADSQAVDGSGEEYLFKETILENCPGWRMVSLYNPKSVSDKIVDPLLGKTGYLAFALCFLVGCVVIILYMMAQKDIRSRKQAEETVRESEEKYRSLFEDSIDGIFITAMDGTLIDGNQSLFDLFGYTKDEILGTSIIKRYANPVDRDRFRHDIEKDGSIRDYPLRLIKKDGVQIDCLLTGTVRKAIDGTILGYRGIIRDITDRKALQQQLLHAQKMEAVGTLAGGIAHDFNNILQAVLGYTELVLQRKQKDEKDYADLENVYLAGQRGADLIQSLLMFSRKTEPIFTPVNLNQEVLQAEKLLSRTIPKTIKIDLHLSGDLELVQADPSQIGQILMNLGVNARDVMRDGGFLTIETAMVELDEEYCKTHLRAKSGRYVLLSVSDTGQGIDKKTLVHIFEPFFSTKEAGKGTGLGLATVYGIVKQHDGYIMCYSEPGHGTTFKIYFPVMQKEGDSATPTIERPIRGGTETILLVDDEEVIRELGTTLLGRFGYEVIAADNGREAIDIYQREGERISLLILDLIMPEMDGRQCLTEILRIDPKARVLIASGYSENGPMKGTSLTGARGFVEKPYNMRQLLQRVREVLDTD